MKKILTILLIALMLAGCGNQNTLGFGNYTYNYVSCQEDYADLKNEKVVSWKDFDGEQIEVTTEDNNYLLSSNKCILSKEKVE